MHPLEIREMVHPGSAIADVSAVRKVAEQQRVAGEQTHQDPKRAEKSDAEVQRVRQNMDPKMVRVGEPEVM